MDAGGDRAGDHDDAGARPLLRGPGPLEEHPEYLHDEHRRNRRGDDCLGGDRLLDRLRGRRRLHRQLRLCVSQGRRIRTAGGDNDPAPSVHGLPGQLLHPHRGTRLGRRRRADPLRPLPDLRGPLVHPGLSGDGALGFRRRVPGRGRDARLRRWRISGNGFRIFSPGSGAVDRSPQGLRSPGAAAAQLGVRPARRRPALVRLVRIQRRQRHRCQRQQRARLHQHAAHPGLHCGGLVRSRPDPGRQGDGGRSRNCKSSSAASPSPRRPGSSARCGRWFWA